MIHRLLALCVSVRLVYAVLPPRYVVGVNSNGERERTKHWDTMIAANGKTHLGNR